MRVRVFLGALLIAASALGQQIITPAGTTAHNAQAVQGVTGGIPVAVSGSLSVSGTADLPGNTATFNANNVCSVVLTAGEQSVGFHLTAGTLDATLTAYGTNATGAVNCATAGTCTALTFSSGSTIVVTNPSGVKDVGVNVVGGLRQVEVCTTTYASGSATGVVTATFLQAASSGGGGGSVTQGTSPWVVAGGGTAGTAASGVVTVQGIASMTAVKTDGSGVTQPVSAATLPLPTNASTSALQTTGNTSLGSIDGKLVDGHGTAAAALRVELPTDGTGTVGLNAGSAVIGHVINDASSAVIGHVIADTGSTTAVTGTVTVAQATGTNLHAVLDTTSTTAATQATASNLNAQVQGPAASGASKSGNPVQVGGVFNTTQPTVTTGQAVEAQSTARGALIVATGTDTFNATVSGTVTTTPPSNASTNVAQLAGTTTDTNSGVKSAGTLRVVLATDQPALTNKLLVTPDSVALPANQSVNVSQINAVTPLMGNGTTGTGSQRVTIASDNTAFSVNAVQSGTWTVQPGNTANTTAWKVDGSAVTQPVAGTVASGATAAGNPLGNGGRAATTVPTAVADTQRVENMLDKFGRVVTTANGDRALITQNAVQVSTTAETTLLTAVASTFLDLTAISCSHSSTTADLITIRDTTGGTARLYIQCPAVAGPCEGWVFPTPFKQTTVNTNWTIQEGTTDATVSCIAQSVSNK